MKVLWMGLLAPCLLAAAIPAAELVEVPGSKNQFPSAIEAAVAGKQVKMVLTGTAIRRKYLVNVYALGSYLQDGVQVHNADELAASAAAKQVELVMERDVAGKDMAEAFQAGIRLNYPEPAFNDEIKRLVDLLQKETMRKGEHVLLTFVPNVGLHVNAAGKADFTIKNPGFARAVWAIYLGKKNLGEAIKKGLASRL